jgi:hypothetical protein
MEQMNQRIPELSIVVPVFNEAVNLRPLVEAVRQAVGQADDWDRSASMHRHHDDYCASGCVVYL